MKTIQLTQGKAALVDDDDFNRLNLHRWCARKQKRLNKTVYYAVRNKLQAEEGSSTVLMHREILGLISPKIQADHRNTDTLDNRKQNLRIATNTQNAHNSRKAPGKTSQFKGVTWCEQKGKWMSRIHVNGHQYYLGFFEIEKDAAQAYNSAAKQEFGDFALVNTL